MANWDGRFFQLAQLAAGWSKDPNKKVGATLVRPDKTVSSIGYNGFPRGVADRAERLQHKELKNLLMVHAEANALVNSRDPELTGHTLYCTEFCCCACSALLIQKGITRLVVPKPNPQSSWYGNYLEAREILRETGVIVDYFNADTNELF